MAQPLNVETPASGLSDSNAGLGRLLPCPFCGAGETRFESAGQIWMGEKYSAPVSVSVRHWCVKVEGQPRRSIERIGRDEESAVAAWNMRSNGQG